jgi:hypothetical protein
LRTLVGSGVAPAQLLTRARILLKAYQAEIELSVLQRQCLDRRLGDRVTMEREVAARVATRNETAATIDWRFITADARVKLKRLYPVFRSDGALANLVELTESPTLRSLQTTEMQSLRSRCV